MRKPDRVKEQDRAKSLKSNFNMTIEQYDEILASQGGVCICGRVPDNKRLAVDHDRSCCSGRTSCGKCIRGLLCSNCNTALGLLKDNIELMGRLMRYIENGK